MSVWIEADCINCDLCAPECPNMAIYRGEQQYQVDAELCTECVGFYHKPACIEVCPLDCIEFVSV
ncbi:YfhL family 4Fe-4S dicluster ferredoxin [Rheinheimera sp. 1928-s]|uniref:YfhL family 4Fe-4S dicluster ferredoxin n=1 Tax=Rheinheimera sp. 1928-s TaxID=3033803 RepID=UPI00261B2D4D|nr:YfhL family 4Fe-4S dicluster ferredoxin [Rheinheimera sp. 1928-s]MDF3124757.1 YfhL family 4Fe-4S dicluster ferredoxin [Rheinheimera sp. 1928-s]